ncbi:MAG: hypothetical protein PHC28_11725 [Flavobacterium sp.]|uniref:hypothetical protein n=1 Tax=Flavobacterium sp. TaxID=239 RepID=UPI0026248642|nr:hypothetical protein [Flavobacterium sp.]MDD5151122.1 hypothetical protein [Flavobacterium sp.]
MKTYEEFNESYVDERRCTAIVINSIAKYYGLDTIIKDGELAPLDGISTIARLKQAGLKVKNVLDQEYIGKTLKSFVKNHPIGVFYVGIRGHALAVIDGKLIDSSNKGIDNRKIIGHFEIIK